VDSKRFPTTRWSLVLQAGADCSAAAGSAFAHLCRAYWYPIYAFVRQRGHSSHDAQDLTQAFFTQLLERQSVEHASPERGRFRTFVLAALKNFLANEWEKAQAVKRGGGQTILSFDRDEAESRFYREPFHELTPETLFERRWALELLSQALAALEREYRSASDAALFAELKAVLVGERVSYADIAGRLGRSEGAIKVAAHRLRHRYRELLRAEIAETVGEGEVDDEVSHLLTILARQR
jgi:RNA polymerase sigma factor (sigma-70 family)